VSLLWCGRRIIESEGYSNIKKKRKMPSPSVGDIDVDQLEPIDGEDDPDKPLIVWGYTLSEVLLICNALAGFALAYMALFGRNPQRYNGISFVDSCLSEFFPDETSIFPAVLSPPTLASLISYVLTRFFNESASTIGGSVVMDSLFALYAAITLHALLEASRRNVVTVYGLTGKILAALFPMLCQMIGICVIYPVFMAWMWSKRRGSVKQEKVDGMPMNDVDPRRVFLACLTALSIIGLHVLFLNGGSREIPHKFEPFQVIGFLTIPMIPAFFIIFLPSLPPAKSRQTRLFSGVASLFTFLIIGAAGFAVHSAGFSHYEKDMKASGGQNVVQLISKDALSSAPSRFLFVEFVHLELSCILTIAMDMQGTGGMGLIMFVTALVGPAGSFALLAAHHEFRLMREDKLI